MPPPPSPPPSGYLMVCGVRVYADAPVVSFADPGGFNAYREACYTDENDKPTNRIHPFKAAKGLENAVRRYRERRLMGGTRDFRRLQEVIRQFVFHHDGCAHSKMCFRVLHDERGLSVHFLIDNDGTIYQTLDLCDGAFHATGVNEISLGVELCSRGKVELDGPNYYRERYPHVAAVRDRNVTRVRIHNSNYEMWDYTSLQYDSMIRLGRALSRLFPNLPQVFPAFPDGNIVNTWLQDPRAFAGYVGHYHVTNQKWDPGCFNFKYFCDKIRARASWFVGLGGSENRATEIAEDPTRAEQQGEELYRNNEEESMGGFFPVGPFGKTRLWHGGIHLNLGEGTPVYCPFSGKVVACKFAGDEDVGSVNFVLTRHDFHLGGKPVTFFLLFMHLEKAEPLSARPPWVKGADKAPYGQALIAEEVAFPMVDLAGGDIVGYAGHAGPPGDLEGQVHIEVFSAEEISERLDPSAFTRIDAGRSGHFCDANEVLSLIDRPKGRGDGLLSDLEIRNFFRQDESKTELHKMAIRFQSEWGQDPNYQTQLLRSKDFALLPKAARQRIYSKQIEPTLFWTEEFAEKVGLPKDFVVWHYHPVRFIPWMSSMLQKRMSQAEPIKVGDGKAAADVSDGITEGMTAFTGDEDEYSFEAGKKLELEQLAGGYPEDPKGNPKP